MLGHNKTKLANRIETIIGQGIVIDGILHGDTNIRVDGTLKGNITIDGLIIVGKTGILEGTVSTQNLIVAGLARGNMIGTERIELLPGGQLLGDITTKMLVTAEGAIFDGNCHTNIPPATDSLDKEDSIEDDIVFL